MNRSTAILLVCLRLAIGWHFLVEGWHKVHSQLVGPAETNRVFSSEGFFREAPGPLARLIKSQLGNPDDELLARLTVQPLPADADPAKYPAQKRIPPALARDWEGYFARFATHYGLDDQHKRLGEAKVEQAEHNVAVWLTQGENEVKKPFPTGDVERKETNVQRITDYRAKVQEIRDTYEKKLPALGRDVAKANLVKAKADLAKQRAELADDLKEKTLEMQKTLNDLLSPLQAQRPETAVTSIVAVALAPVEGRPWLIASSVYPGRTIGEVPEPGADQPAPYTMKIRAWVRGGPDAPTSTPLTNLEIMNFLTRWGLLVIGAGLLLGLGTRTWCILGAGFLLMTYLAAPPVPWWPTPPQQEGTYLFINKNVVEMLALLVLATTQSGRWFGLDALIYGVFTGFRNKRQPANERR